MNPEAQIIQLLAHLGILKITQTPSTDITAIMTGINQVKADIAALQTEMRQDLAALGDELAALRRHSNEHVTSHRSRCFTDQPTTEAPRSAHAPDSIAY